MSQSHANVQLSYTNAHGVSLLAPERATCFQRPPQFQSAVSADATVQFYFVQIAGGMVDSHVFPKRIAEHQSGLQFLDILAYFIVAGLA